MTILSLLITDLSRIMQRMKVGPMSGASKQEAQDDMEDQKILARRTVLITFAAFGAIVLALRVGKSSVV